MRVEINSCKQIAETYRDAGSAAPLYRLPTAAYSHSLPALLGDGAVSEAVATALMPFFSEVEALNRGLDLAQSARERGDQQALKEEHARNLLTIRRLLELFSQARGVVDRHR